MLGLGADAPEKEEPTEPSRSGSLLGLDGLARRPESSPPTEEAMPSPTAVAPEEEELFHLDRPRERAFPIERAILFSLAAHVLVLILILRAPGFTSFSTSPRDARKGLLGAFIPEERPQDKIPIVFRAAPGPARENPKPAPFSDATRRAGGGDPSRAKSAEPFVPQKPGIDGLAEGPRGATAARAPATRAGRKSEQGAGEQKSATAGSPGERQTGGPDAFRVPPPGASSPRSGSPSADGAGLADLDRVIREAAKGVENPGENGAGFPNEGGFVDSGPISFDTAWYNWGPYAAEMVRRIKLHWDIPELARLGWKGKLTIRFFIRGNGSVEGAKIVSQSGIPPFDFASLQAILKSNPFRPLPKDLGSDREGVTVTFFYNIRPGKNGEGEETH